MSTVGRTQDPTLDEPTPVPSVDPVAVRAAHLLRRAAEGDRTAFGQLVILYQDRMFNAVLRIVGDRDDASELTQEAFARALAALPDFRGDAHPYTWLFRIALNLAISRLRQDRRRRTFSLDQPTNGRGNRPADQASALVDRMRGQSPDPAATAERRERAEQVLAALGRVDAEHRAVLVMRDVDGLDYQQMADVLDLPLGTLKSRLFRARVALRDELKTYMKG
jgi:RNA polymerase sigma-70 factor (ECF subfamily)